MQASQDQIQQESQSPTLRNHLLLLRSLLVSASKFVLLWGITLPARICLRIVEWRRGRKVEARADDAFTPSIVPHTFESPGSPTQCDTAKKLYGQPLNSLDHYWIAPQFRAQYPWQPGPALSSTKPNPLLLRKKRKVIAVRWNRRELGCAYFGVCLAWTGCILLCWSAFSQAQPLVAVWAAVSVILTGLATQRLVVTVRNSAVPAGSSKKDSPPEDPDHPQTAGPGQQTTKRTSGQLKAPKGDQQKKSTSESTDGTAKSCSDSSEESGIKPPCNFELKPETNPDFDPDFEPEFDEEFILVVDPLIGPAFVEYTEPASDSDVNKSAGEHPEGGAPKNSPKWPWPRKWHNAVWNEDLIQYN